MGTLWVIIEMEWFCDRLISLAANTNNNLTMGGLLVGIGLSVNVIVQTTV